MWTRGRFVDEYVPGLFAVGVDSYMKNRAESMWDKLCTVKTSQKKERGELRKVCAGYSGVKARGCAYYL